MKSYAALLFDMDGTILSSLAAAERIWGAWAARHGVDFEALKHTLHGARASDTIRKLNLPNVDPEHEARGIKDAEVADVEGIVPLEGAIEFLATLPADKWALVTSAPLELALSRMHAAAIPMPRTAITGESVSRGKPAPDCFLLAAERLGVDIRDCLIFEDSPAGLEAARASGADVIAVTPTMSYTTLTAELDGAKIRITHR